MREELAISPPYLRRISAVSPPYLRHISVPGAGGAGAAAARGEGGRPDRRRGGGAGGGGRCSAKGWEHCGRRGSPLRRRCEQVRCSPEGELHVALESLGAGAQRPARRLRHACRRRLRRRWRGRGRGGRRRRVGMSSGSTACPAETVTGQPLMNHVLDARVVRGIGAEQGFFPLRAPKSLRKSNSPYFYWEKRERGCVL